MSRIGPSGLAAEFLVGGITKADIQQDVGLVWKSADPTSMLLPPLPNFLFQRDPSCWISTGSRSTQRPSRARKPETMIMETIYRFHLMFAAEKFPIWLGGTDETWGRCHVEGGDVQPIGNGTVMIGIGERTTPRLCCGSLGPCFAPGLAARYSPCTRAGSAVALGVPFPESCGSAAGCRAC